MTPLNNDQKEAIIRRISFIKEEMPDIDRNLDWTTYRLNKNIRKQTERTIENISNALIDVAKLLLISENIRLPETYQETFLKLGELGIITQDETKILAKCSRLRNILAHEYLDLRWPLIKEFVQDDIKTVEKIILTVENLISV